MLSVSCACFMCLHHRTDGKSSAHVQSPTMVLFLKVWMERSAALERWLCGSTSCILMPSSSRYDLTAFVATLSMMLNTGLKFRFLKDSMFVLNAYTVVSFLNFYWCGEDGVGGPIVEYENSRVTFHALDGEVASTVDVYCSLFWLVSGYDSVIGRASCSGSRL